MNSDPAPSHPSGSGEPAGGHSGGDIRGGSDFSKSAHGGLAARWVPPAVEEMQKLLPEYEIVEMLGSGGMGAVYMGRQKSLDRPVAIKILSATLEHADPVFVERFKNEARAMAKLNHPGIVAVYDFGEAEGGLLYIVMEYVEGTDVARSDGKRTSNTGCPIMKNGMPMLAKAAFLGGEWPPPARSGNFSDAARQRQAARFGTSYIPGYDDGFPTTAPVMRYPANNLGFHDLGGNAWEWCGDDAKRASSALPALRGGSWTTAERERLLCSFHADITPGNPTYGFRVVIERP